MILNHKAIEAYALHGMLGNYSDELMNGTSLDVRLGNVFLKEVQGEEVAEDEYAMLNLGQRDPITTERIEATDEEPLLLYPGQFVLASTVESFKLPLNVSAEFRLKSSVGRMGLSHALAVWCDPGWHGHLTLELHNISQHHVVALRPGDRIGQMIFHEHEPVSQRMDYGKRGSYNSDVEPVATRPS